MPRKKQINDENRYGLDKEQYALFMEAQSRIGAKGMGETVSFLVEYFLSTYDSFGENLRNNVVSPEFQNFAKKYPRVLAYLPKLLEKQKPKEAKSDV